MEDGNWKMEVGRSKKYEDFWKVIFTLNNFIKI